MVPVTGAVVRGCMFPDCAETFDIAAVSGGTARADGWRQVRLFTGYLCPAHAALCITGGHVPRWLDPDIRDRPGVLCGCGWQWQPVHPANLAAHAGQWVTHLAGLPAEAA
jgi:hypothetical protein